MAKLLLSQHTQAAKGEGEGLPPAGAAVDASWGVLDPPRVAVVLDDSNMPWVAMEEGLHRQEVGRRVVVRGC